MKVIDIRNGDFYLNPKEILGSKKSYTEVLTYTSLDSYSNIDTGYNWIYFKNKQIGALFFNIAVCFYKESINLINFSFREELNNSQNWDTWSESSERQKKKIFESWLTENIGTNNIFNWGKITSFYDPKGGNAGILITYKR